MKRLKKINLKGLTNVLNEKEMKNVLGGSGAYGYCGNSSGSCGGYCATSGYTCKTHATIGNCMCH